MFGVFERSSSFRRILFNCKHFQKSFQIDCVRSNSLCRSPGLYTRKVPCPSPGEGGGGECSGCSNDHPLFGEYCLTVNLQKSFQIDCVRSNSLCRSPGLYTRKVPCPSPGEGGRGVFGVFERSSSFRRILFNCKKFQKSFQIDCVRSNSLCRSPGLYTRKVPCPSPGEGGGVCSGCSNDHPLFGEYYLTVQIFRNHSRLIVYARTPFAEARAYIRERYLARPLGRGGEGCVRGVRTIILFSENII